MKLKRKEEVYLKTEGQNREKSATEFRGLKLELNNSKTVIV